MTFHIEGWSVFYREARGGGVVRCDNGQEARIGLETNGVGVTFGSTKIVGGSGRFSSITDIDEIFGHYASAEAHAGMGVSSGAQVMTKGSVSLAVSGTGNGVNIGFAFGRFTIRPASIGKRNALPRGQRLLDEDLPPAVTTPEEGY